MLSVSGTGNDSSNYNSNIYVKENYVLTIISKDLKVKMSCYFIEIYYP